jgi:phosphoribosyl-ATP pyrophosphohydrolase
MTVGSVPDRRGRLSVMAESAILTALMDVIKARKTNPPERPSYVAGLLRSGVDAIGKKIVEEAAEVVEAGAEPGDAGREHLIREAADLVFHTMVLLGYRDIEWSDVETELARRFGTSGIAEKESRGASG